MSFVARYTCIFIFLLDMFLILLQNCPKENCGVIRPLWVWHGRGSQTFPVLRAPFYILISSVCSFSVFLSMPPIFFLTTILVQLKHCGTMVQICIIQWLMVLSFCPCAFWTFAFFFVYLLWRAYFSHPCLPYSDSQALHKIPKFRLTLGALNKFTFNTLLIK